MSSPSDLVIKKKRSLSTIDDKIIVQKSKSAFSKAFIEVGSPEASVSTLPTAMTAPQSSTMSYETFESSGETNGSIKGRKSKIKRWFSTVMNIFKRGREEEPLGD